MAGTLQFVGNATVLLRFGPVTLLTDPNFLHAGDHAHLGYGMTSRRLRDPAFPIEALPRVDAVVLSHYHGDHFDQIVEARLDRDLPIVTNPQARTILARKGFRAVRGLATWETTRVGAGDDAVSITAVPGRHGPGALDALLPRVMGSMIEAPRPGARPYRLYISGDTLLDDALREIPERYPDIDCALIHLGGTRIFGVLLTLDGAGGVELIRLVRPRAVVPIHYEEYTVMKSPLADFTTAIDAAGLRDLVRYVDRGETVDLP